MPWVLTRAHRRRISTNLSQSFFVPPEMNTSSGIHGIPAIDPVLIWESDALGRRVFLDDAWLEFTGRADDPALAKGNDFSTWKRDVHPEDLSVVEHALESHLVTHQPFRVEYRLMRQNGEFCWVMDVGSPRFDEAGDFSGFVGQCFVIDELKQALLKSAAEIEHRDQFLAFLAHELRNPLSAIMHGIFYGNQSNEVPDGLKKVWEIIDRQAKHMSKLLDDLLDVSRVRQNKIVLDKQLIDLRDIVTEVFESSQLYSTQKQLELKLSCTDGDVFVEADGNRIRQAIANLMDNAIKYTPAGGSVTVRLERDQNHAIVSICDSGQGIQKEHLDDVFELFFQESPPLDQAGGGLGVGLFLVKQILEEHGGTAEAFSDGPDQGSRFVVSIPLAPNPPTED